MPNRMARPGQLTCVDLTCARSGQPAAEGNTSCAVCGGALERVPDEPPARFTTAPAPTYRPSSTLSSSSAPPTTAWSDRPRGFRIAVAIGIAVAFMLLTYVIDNWDAITGPDFKVGDCATVSTGLLDSTMHKAECGSSRKKLSTNPADLVYRVESVVDHKDGTCRGGFDRITFSNEPEDTTYCLVLTR
ncbi:hypothetical protein AB0J72_17645 [Dactylosporangium sp. NPDC049742]|uniref:hypothetical protein n=1 Tax=Dactylosporangium sp. NPDC049742 TaxID=3154737 RepID=UPI003444A1FE